MLFDDVVHSHSARLYRLAYFYLRDGPAAEDAVQESFLIYLREASAVRDPGPWLNRVVRNVCLNELRKRRREQPAELDQFSESDSDAAFVDPIAAVPAALTMTAALLRLPLAYREVLVWHYYLEVPTVDLASRLSLTPSGLRARLMRARQALARLLKEDDQ